MSLPFNLDPMFKTVRAPLALGFLGLTASSCILSQSSSFFSGFSSIICENTNKKRNTNENADPNFEFSSRQNAREVQNGWYTEPEGKRTTLLYSRDLFVHDRPLQAIDLELKTEEIREIKHKGKELRVKPVNKPGFYLMIPSGFVAQFPYKRLPLYKEHIDPLKKRKDVLDFQRNASADNIQAKKAHTDFRQVLIYGGGNVAATIARALRETGFGGDLVVLAPKGEPLPDKELIESYQVTVKEGSISKFLINDSKVVLKNGETLPYQNLCLAFDENKNPEELETARHYFGFEKDEGMFTDNLNKTAVENIYCAANFCNYPDYKMALRRKVKDDLNLSRMAFYTSQNLQGRNMQFHIAKEI